MLRCRDCGQEKEPEEFPRNRSSASGRGRYCKPCHNARGRETVKRLYGDSRHYHYKQKYGISRADYDEMLRQQLGICVICKWRPATQVDHDHKTGTVRALLCLKCNAGLGAFHDDVEAMCRAADYLEANR